jgi:hypothetical protein
MSLSQSSLQTGALAPSVATQMSLDPIASLLLGIFAFDETVHEDTVGLIAALAAFAVMIAGIVSLAASEQEPGEGEPVAQPAPAAPG